MSRKAVFLGLAAILALLAIAKLFLKASFLKPFKIVSLSMAPALEPDDLVYAVVWLTKAARERELAKLERGEILVFEHGQGARAKWFVFRCAALPGDKIEIKAKKLFVNGRPESFENQNPPARLLPENLKNEEVWGEGPNQDWLRPYVLGGQEYFFLGDNRDNAWDSRYFGPVRAEKIFGKAVVRYWPPARSGRVR